MNLVISKCVTAVKVSNFSCHYLRKRSTLDIGVLGYICIVQHNQHSPEVLSLPPGTPCIYIYIHIYIYIYQTQVIWNLNINEIISSPQNCSTRSIQFPIQSTRHTFYQEKATEAQRHRSHCITHSLYYFSR